MTTHWTKYTNSTTDGGHLKERWHIKPHTNTSPHFLTALYRAYISHSTKHLISPITHIELYGGNYGNKLYSKRYSPPTYIPTRQILANLLDLALIAAL